MKKSDVVFLTGGNPLTQIDGINNLDIRNAIKERIRGSVFDIAPSNRPVPEIPIIIPSCRFAFSLTVYRER